MLNQVEQKVCKRVLALEDKLITVLSKLVSINTTNPLGENYDDCAEFLATYLEELVVNVKIWSCFALDEFYRRHAHYEQLMQVRRAK